MEPQVLSQAPNPPILRGVIHFDGRQLVWTELHGELEPHFRARTYVVGTGHHDALSVSQEGEGLARSHALRHGHLKHLVIRGGLLLHLLLLALRLLWQLESHALIGAHIGRTRHHDLLIIDHDSELLA
jgi:hypothetical protein